MATDKGTYAYSRSAAWERYSTCLAGSDQVLFLVVIQDEPNTALKDALEKAALARGYLDSATWITVGASSAGGSTLDNDQILEVIEALDPVCVVVLGSAVEAFAETYRMSSLEEQSTVAFGRPVCLIPNAQKLVETEEGKQHLWALIKSLPEFHTK